MGAHQSRKADRRVGLCFDDRCLLHDPHERYHPEQPARISSILDRLAKDGLTNRCIPIEASEITVRELLLTHTRDHIKSVEKAPSKIKFPNKIYNIDPDTYVSAESYLAACVAAGGVTSVATAVATGEIDSGIVVVRPPGHHAGCAKAEGFCLFNNIAVAINVVRQDLGVKRIMIVDWDVHHGNGTQELFLNDSDVVFFSVHRFESGFYPDSGPAGDVGKGSARGKTINMPMPCAGLGDEHYLQVWSDLLLPIVESFDPEMIFVSAGFDAAQGDPLGQMEITPFGYARMTHQLAAICPKIVMALEGGYNLSSISASASACVNALLGSWEPGEPKQLAAVAQSPLSPRFKQRRFEKELQKVIELQKKYWPVLSEQPKVPKAELPSVSASPPVTPVKRRRQVEEHEEKEVVRDEVDKLVRQIEKLEVSDGGPLGESESRAAPAAAKNGTEDAREKE